MHYGKPKSASESDIYYSGSNPKTNMKWFPVMKLMAEKVL